MTIWQIVLEMDRKKSLRVLTMTANDAKSEGTTINTKLYQVDCWRKCAGTFCMATWPIFFIVGRILDVLVMTASDATAGWVRTFIYAR